jgi:hypothetical protein
MEKQFNFPKQITVSQLNEIDGYAISTEICHRYNTYADLIQAGKDMQDEAHEYFYYKNVYKVVSIVALLGLAISLCV